MASDGNEHGITDNSVIPRNRLFVLTDGTFVVRWGESNIQELESGQYRAFESKDFDAPITDYELKQLVDAGIVNRFDDDNIWLNELPERNKFDKLATWELSRVRSYYLNTTLPGSLLDDVRNLLTDLGLTGMFQPRIRDDFVVLWGNKGMAFHKVDEAEKARYVLTSKAPEAFINTVIAFVETDRRD